VALKQPTRGAGSVPCLLIGCSVALMVLVGALGPSAAVLPLSPHTSDGSPPAAVVTALLAIASILGAVGLALGVRALQSEWAPAPRRLLAAGVLATGAVLLVPPMATADIGSYAAYGRMVVLHHDPYVTSPRDLASDPIVGAAEAPWLDAPSVYGPLATGEQALVARIGGDSRALALRGLEVLSALAFLATGFLLESAARGGRDSLRRRRFVALLWTCNPLLILQLVAAGHVDGLLCLLVLGGVLLAARRPAVAGALLGLAGAVKATAIVPVLGVLTALRPRRASMELVSAGVGVTVVAYASAGAWHVLTPARTASRAVSRGTPWRWIASGLERVLPHNAARDVVVYAAVLLAVVLAIRMSRRLPAGPVPVVRSAFLAVLAWTLVAPYALPWYDALAWCALGALVATGGLARPSWTVLLLVVHTGVLTVAYLPGRTVPLGEPLEHAMNAVRSGVAPLIVAACFLAAWRWGPAGAGGAGDRTTAENTETAAPTRDQQPDIAGQNA
jgi:hypothetical protein